MSYTNDLTNLANIASVVTSGITSNGTAITKISVGNSTVNSVVNSTGIYVNGSVIYQTTDGLSANVLVLTSNAATYLGNSSGTLANIQNYITGNAATAYTNATSYADTKAGTAYTNATSYADTVAANAYSNATSYADTKAGTAYTNATSYADTVAANAYSNAISYANTAAGNAYTNATSYADTKAANAYSNAISYANTAAGNAYTNATSYADTKAGTAYTNATSYADIKAGNAYTNATTYVTTGGYTITGAVTHSGNVNITGNTTSVLNIGTINATSIGMLANSTVLTVGNSSVNTTVNATAFSGTANNADNLGGLSLGQVQGNAASNAATAYTNATSYADTKAANAYSNATSYADIKAGNAYTNATSYVTAGGYTVVGDVTFSGNIFVNGTTFNANVTNLNVKDLNILVGDGAASNASSDGAGLTVSTPNAQLFYSGGSNTWNTNRTFTPGSNVTFDLGSTTLTWSNVFANQVYGTLMTASQPNITANNANNLGGTSLATLQGQITGNAATAYTNATSYADTKAGTAYTNATSYADTVAANAYSNAVANAAAVYQTTAGLSANVLLLTSNAATYIGNSSGTIGNITAWITGNSATAYTNATTYVTTGGYTISGIVTHSGDVVLTSGNATNQLLIGTINATSIGLLANSTLLTIGNSSVNTTVNATSYSGTANNANNLGGTSLATLQGEITGNAATAYTNATSYADNKAANAYSNAITYSANADNISSGTVTPARLGSGTANSTTILYGNGVFALAPSSTNASALTTGTVNASLLASGTANSTTILYGNSVWAVAPDSTNASSLTTGTVAPARLGTGANSTNILYGNGVFAAPQSPVAGGNTIITTGTGANQSITLSSVTIVANDIIVTFNGLRQTPNSYAVTSGTLYVTAPANSDVVVQLAGGPVGPTGANGASLVALVKQQYTANGTGTQFAVSGGYSAGAMTVYVNGVKQLETTDVITSSGSNVVFNTAPPSTAQIDIFGFSSIPQIASNTSVVSQQFTANGIANSFIVSGGYTPGIMQVFVNGVKYVESSDVVTSSGTTVNFTTAPANGSIIDVFGQVSIPAVTPNYLLLTGGTVSGTINVGSNVSITTDGITINNFKTVAANYLLLSTDYIVQANNSLTLTLMAASTVAGKQFFIRNINTSDINIVGNTSSETINGYANIVMQFKNSSLGLISTGSSWIIN